jgi:nicotinamide riboside transporter PnuC
MKKAAIILAGVLIIGSGEPVRAVNVPDWGLAGVSSVVSGSSFFIGLIFIKRLIAWFVNLPSSFIIPDKTCLLVLIRWFFGGPPLSFYYDDHCNYNERNKGVTREIGIMSICNGFINSIAGYGLIKASKYFERKKREEEGEKGEVKRNWLRIDNIPDWGLAVISSVAGALLLNGFMFLAGLFSFIGNYIRGLVIETESIYECWDCRYEFFDSSISGYSGIMNVIFGYGLIKVSKYFEREKREEEGEKGEVKRNWLRIDNVPDWGWGVIAGIGGLLFLRGIYGGLTWASINFGEYSLLELNNWALKILLISIGLYTLISPYGLLKAVSYFKNKTKEGKEKRNWLGMKVKGYEEPAKAASISDWKAGVIAGIEGLVLLGGISIGGISIGWMPSIYDYASVFFADEALRDFLIIVGVYTLISPYGVIRAARYFEKKKKKEKEKRNWLGMKAKGYEEPARAVNIHDCGLGVLTGIAGLVFLTGIYGWIWSIIFEPTHLLPFYVDEDDWWINYENILNKFTSTIFLISLGVYTLIGPREAIRIARYFEKKKEEGEVKRTWLKTMSIPDWGLGVIAGIGGSTFFCGIYKGLMCYKFSHFLDTDFILATFLFIAGVYTLISPRGVIIAARYFEKKRKKEKIKRNWLGMMVRGSAEPLKPARALNISDSVLTGIVSAAGGILFYINDFVYMDHKNYSISKILYYTTGGLIMYGLTYGLIKASKYFEKKKEKEKRWEEEVKRNWLETMVSDNERPVRVINGHDFALAGIAGIAGIVVGVLPQAVYGSFYGMPLPWRNVLIYNAMYSVIYGLLYGAIKASKYFERKKEEEEKSEKEKGSEVKRNRHWMRSIRSAEPLKPVKALDISDCKLEIITGIIGLVFMAGTSAGIVRTNSGLLTFLRNFLFIADIWALISPYGLIKAVRYFDNREEEEMVKREELTGKQGKRELKSVGIRKDKRKTYS